VNKFIIASSFLLIASVGRATNSTCTTAAALSSFGTAGTGVGCFAVDKSFTNLGVNNVGTIGTTQTGATDLIASSNTLGMVTNPWTVTATFTPAAAADWQATGSTGSELVGLIGGTAGTQSVSAGVPGEEGMVVNSTGTFITCGSGTGENTQCPTPTTGNHFNITSVGLSNVSGTDGANASDDIKVVEIFCVGTATCTAADEVTILASISGSGSSTASYTCTPGSGVTYGSCGTASATGVAFTFNTHENTINVVNEYALQVFNVTEDTLSSFQDVFGEDEVTPEPSTFVLFGTALALIGLLRFRAHRKAAVRATR
jgi:hypothetical protein